MKPNFALTLSSEGIRLLQRAPSGWLLVGDVTFISDDLTADMADLRAKAARLDDAPLCKLVIPNEQIKYLTVASTAKTEDEAEDDASHALRGATPYELYELAFDWAMDDGQLFVAAVARETLDEAENFAVEHGFHPVSFVALPDQSDFAGEPFFGLSKWARDELPETGSLTRDLQPIHIIGKADIPDPMPEPEPEPIPEPEPELESVPEPEPSPEPTEEPQQAQTDQPADLGSENAVLPEDVVADPDPATSISPAEQAAPPSTPAPSLSFSSVRTSRETAPHVAPVEPEKSALSTTSSRLNWQSQATPQPKPVAPPPAKPTPTPLPITAPASPEPPIEPPAADGLEPQQSESQRLTVFGMRGADKTPPVIGGKPKHLGLVLTAILLMFLAAMAIWAAFIGEDGLAGLFGEQPSEVQVAALPEAPPVAPHEATAEELAEADDAEAAGNVTEGPNAPEATQAVLLPDTPQILPPEQAEQHYITTGIWQTAPDQPTSPDAIGTADAYQASIDPTIHGTDAIALPDAELQRDVPPGRAQNPAAAGTNFDMDRRGLVKATPEGALNPDGVLIYAGKPPLLPPAMPNRTETGPDAAERAKLATKRPKARPGDLQEKTERNQLGGRTRTELAGLRPRLRPDTISQQAVQQAVADAVEQAQQEDEAGTELAVLESLKPRLRPSGFSKIVAKTDDRKEPARTAAAAPQIPSSASVARQATVKNALNLRQVNLIGVYGKPSDRRALIRLSNGRYKKVQVGDRIDGGKVAAISETELRYVKNGRNVVLKMPRG